MGRNEKKKNEKKTKIREKRTNIRKGLNEAEKLKMWK